MLRMKCFAVAALATALLAGALGAQVYINEYCNDPFGAVGLDTNLDGTASTSSEQSNDEFVEIVNAGPATVDISNWEVWDAVGSRHVFAVGTMLPAGAGIVVFGGGDVTNFNAMGWATGVTATSGALGLNNSNDSVLLYDATLTLVDGQMYGSGPAAGDGDGESITRVTDMPGDLFVAHTTVPSGLAHSAGLKNDGVTPWLPAIIAPPIPPAYPGNATDFTIGVSVNGVSISDPTDVYAGLAVFDWVNLWFNSPGGTTALQPFSAFYQVYGPMNSLALKSIPGETGVGWWLDDGVAPPNPGGITPPVVFIDGLQLLIGGQLVPPVLPQTFGFNYTFQIPPVLSGLELHVQALILEPGLNAWNLGITNDVVFKTM